MRNARRISTAAVALALGLAGAACEEDTTGDTEEPVEDIVEQTADEADEIDPTGTEPGLGEGDDVGDESPGEG